MFTKFFRIWQSQINVKRFYSGKHQLKPFYMLVHPDLFHNQPEKRRVNEESLKIFHSYMNDASKSKYNVTLNFHVKQHTDLTFHAKVRVTSDMTTQSLVQNVLKACRLPHVNVKEKKVDLHDRISSIDNRIFNENLFNKRNNRFRKINSFEETSLKDWIGKSRNTIFKNNLSGKVDLCKYEIIVKRFQSKYGIKGILAEERKYSYATVIRALRHFENLIDREMYEPDKLLNGFMLKFDRFDGLDQFGRFLINVHAVPGDWKQALLNLNSCISSVSNIKCLEKSISEICFGINLKTRRKGGSLPAKIYEKSLKALVTKLENERYEKETHKFTDLGAVYDRDGDSLDVTSEGFILFHPYMKWMQLYEFAITNHEVIKTKRSEYLKGLQVEHEEMETCKQLCKLASFEKEQHLTSSQVIQACTKLKSIESNLLEDVNVIISNYYSVSTDGYVRIPWNFIS